MKRVRISNQKVGLVYRNGDFHNVLFSGKHWLGFNDTIRLFDRLHIYDALADMEIVVQHAEFKANIEQVIIHENEIGLVYARENFRTVLTSGNYFLFKGVYEFKIEKYDLNSVNEITDIDQSILRNNEVAEHVKSFKVESFEAGLLFRDGKFINELSSGHYSYWCGAHALEVMKVDLRTNQLELSGQELLTKDKAAIRVNFQLEYKVVNSQKALLENVNFTKQLYSAGQLALREIIGVLSLDELLESKEKVNDFVLNSLQSKSKDLGVIVSLSGIRDIILPGEMKEIMNQVLIAEKQAQANAIVRREETAATRNLLNTAKLMEDNALLLKLKEMEYVEKIADKIGEIKLSNGGALMDQLTQVLAR